MKFSEIHYPENLIGVYQGLKNKYRSYDTRNALLRMQAFRKSLLSLHDKGFLVGLEILGSLNFGIVEKNSDTDIILLHYCDLHKDTGECMPNCKNLMFEKNIISQVVKEQLQIEKFNIEILDLYQFVFG